MNDKELTQIAIEHLKKNKISADMLQMAQTRDFVGIYFTAPQIRTNILLVLDRNSGEQIRAEFTKFRILEEYPDYREDIKVVKP